MWRGDWQQAEDELTAAVREVSSFRPPMVVESIVRLAELRWRQGRWDEAASLFAQVEGEGLAQLGRAELALSLGDAATAVDLAGRFLRRIPREDRIERVDGLELIVRSALAMGDLAAAHEALDELRSTADEVGTDLLHACASFAEGVVSSAEGDAEAARTALEDAVDLYERNHAPFEAARARMELAQVFALLGRADFSGREAASARQAFERLGAAKEAEKARSFLARVTTPGAQGEPPDRLTAREVDVLRLIASGLSNQEIAKELVLSVRTVERHTSNIYEKIGADGKVARAAATAYAIRHGLA
jgi:ATP/maltotriose-dependent transcriptional regulator MalT